jgi:3-hydroxyisobutyrate dehydrogenase
MKIGFIGTGVMGVHMVRHLSQEHQLTVYNRTLSKAKRLQDVAIVAESLNEQIFHNEIIMTMLGGPQDVEAVYAQLLAHTKPGTMLIDFTTSDPRLAQTLYQQGKQKQIQMFDAPVTGGEKGALNQTLAIMVGGDQDHFQFIEPILKLLGQSILYMGNAGQGQHAKMANQIAIAGTIASLAESLVYAQKQGLALSKVLEYLSKGAASSYSVIHYGPKMVAHDWHATFYLKHYLKDLTIALAIEPNLPVVALVKKQLESLVQTYGEQGVQSLILAYLT